MVTQGGAEAGLEAETSKAKTLGVVIQPEFGSGFGDLSFAADYFDIEVKNGVDSAGGANILSRCYDSGSADFSSGSGLCRLVARNPVNNQLVVTNGFINLSTDKVRGLDFTTRYVREIGPGTCAPRCSSPTTWNRPARSSPTIRWWTTTACCRVRKTPPRWT